MDFVAEFRKPERICAGTTSDIENYCRRFRKSFAQQFFRTLKFQLKRTRPKPLVLRRMFVIGTDLRTEFHHALICSTTSIGRAVYASACRILHTQLKFE